MASLLEHLNLTVADLAEARAFYLALGCTLARDEGHLIHANTATNQFHVLACRDGELPQVWPGTISLLTQRPLDALRAVLLALGGKVTAELQTDAEGQRLDVSGPTGNRFELRRAPEGLAARLATHHRGHRNGCGDLLFMPRVQHRIPAAAVEAVAAFYRDVLGLDVSSSASGSAAAEPAVVVHFKLPASGLEQELVFVPAPEHPPPNAYTASTAFQYHMALYYSSQAAFEAAYARCQARNIVFLNQRFGELAAPDLSATHQFRVVEVAKGLVDLEHEVRGPGHPSCPLPAPECA